MTAAEDKEGEGQEAGGGGILIFIVSADHCLSVQQEPLFRGGEGSAKGHTV